MDTSVVDNKPHAVCLPFPAQSHIKAMLKLAKLLHHRGFQITFVNTEFNHKRFLKSLGPNSLHGLPDFRFETIPDGLPDSNEDATQDVILLCDSIRKNFLAPFRNLLLKLNDMTCIVSDGAMSMFTITAAQELGVPITLFYTISASSIMGIKQQHRALIEKGLAPIKDESYLTNGNDILVNFGMEAIDGVDKASAVVILTFEALEKDVLDALSSMLAPPVYTIGPIQLLLNQIQEDPLGPMGYSLWKEQPECLQWLNNKAPNSVFYVNFGSIAVMTAEQFVEFGWGLANSKLPFLWVTRPDLVVGQSAILPPEFEAEIKERGLIASWCPQEEVLNHPSVGGFLTHSGWNSIIESLTAGVPMLCWPFGGDQPTNCYYACNQWGVGMEVSNDVKRDEVQKLVKELMEGDKGKKMKKKAEEWKNLAEKATGPHGSSSSNFDALVSQVLSLV